jgi:hypothetical protein
MLIDMWDQARDALGETVGRVTTLLRSVTDPARPAVGDWNLGEVAMHLSQVWLAVPGLARADMSEVYEILPSAAQTAAGSLVRDIRDLGDTTMLAVKSDPERDLHVLADRIEARAARYLAEVEGHSPDEQRAWVVEGATVSLLTLTCHLLSETIMHGYDIARAARQPWRIEPANAALVLSGFFVKILGALAPTALVHSVWGANATATFDLRIRGGDRHHFVFNGGQLHIEDPSPHRRVDCHISADPVALLLLMWGRRSQWRAIARGQLVAWGRRPWLGPRLRAMLQNP